MNENEKIAWMRDKGILQAQWSVDGELLMAVLGPEPPPRAGISTLRDAIGQKPLNSPDGESGIHDEPTEEELLLMSA